MNVPDKVLWHDAHGLKILFVLVTETPSGADGTKITLANPSWRFLLSTLRCRRLFRSWVQLFSHFQISSQCVQTVLAGHVLLPDIFIGGEQEDRPGIPSVQQLADDFIEVGGFVVMRDLQRLRNTDPTWADKTKGKINSVISFLNFTRFEKYNLSVLSTMALTFGKQHY